MTEFTLGRRPRASGREAEFMGGGRSHPGHGGIPHAGAAHPVTPLRGFVRARRFSQGVALGWLIAGPLALKAAPWKNFQTRGHPEGPNTRA